MKQDYGRQPKIHDVIIKNLSWKYQDDGQFLELARYIGESKLQLNLSIIQPGAIKAFHQHQLQWDEWFCWEPLLVRLYDGRLDSPSFNTSMRFMLCNQSLRINPGISHGVRNLNDHPVCLFYTVSNFFNPEDPDEIREPWDMLDSPENSLWEMQRG